MSNLKQFLDDLEWSEPKQKLFMNFDKLPPEYLNDKVLKLWKRLKYRLSIFSSVSYDSAAIAKYLKDEDVEAFELIDTLLERVLKQDCNRMRPASEPVSSRMRPSVDGVRPASEPSSGRVRPAKLDDDTIKKIYRQAVSGRDTISAIAERFGISRKTIQLIRGKQIHQNILNCE